MYRLNLDMAFVTYNEYEKATRTDKYFAAGIKKQQTNSVAWIAKSKKFKLPENTKFDVKYIWVRNNNKIDPDNIEFAQKFILDGLQISGSLKNDTHEFRRNSNHIHILNRGQKYISCIVEFIPILD